MKKKWIAMIMLLLAGGWQVACADDDPTDMDVTSYKVVVYQNDDMGEHFTEQWSQQMDFSATYSTSPRLPVPVW